MKIKELYEMTTLNENVYYHITPIYNLDNIIQNGLEPKIGDRSNLIGEEHHSIYLFKDISDIENALMSWMENEFNEDEELALLQITIPFNIKIEYNGFEYTTSQSIPAKYIRVMSYDVYNETNLKSLITEMTSAGNVAGVSMPMGMARRVDPQTLINTYPDHTKPKKKSKKKKKSLKK